MRKKLNLRRIEDRLNEQIDNNIAIQEKGETPIAFNLEGEAGIGKTSIVRQLAEKRGMTYVEVNLSQLDEVGDLIGYPLTEYEAQMFKLYKDGDVTKRSLINTVWTTKDTLNSMNPKSYVLTGKTRMSYAKPSWVPEYNEKGCLVLLDDYTRCTPVFAQAIMGLMLEQKYMSWSLPKKTTVVLTSNPDNGNYNVVGQDAAQSDRCLNFSVDFNEDDWAQWAERRGIDSRCISFALNYGQELFSPDKQGNRIATPRGYTMFCNAISGKKNWEDADTQDYIEDIASGCFNDDKGSFAAMFTTFISKKMHLMVPPKQLLESKWETVMPKLLEQLYTDGNYNASIAAIMERRLTNYILAWLDSDKPTPIAMVKERILDFIRCPQTIFTEDMYYHMVSAITQVHKAQTQKLLYEPEIMKKVA